MWAFATAPTGLGLASDVFWSLTMREFQALKYQWASVRALTLNLQANTDGVPFIPEDLLYGGREERMVEIKAEQQVAEMQARIENFKLGHMKAVGGMDDSDVPASFKGRRRISNG